MSEHVDVRSIESIQLFSDRLVKFRQQMQSELENLSLELERLTSWIQNGSPQYWHSELQRAERHLSECKSALSRCMASVRPDEQRPCTDERKRLRKAEDRAQLCSEKLRYAKSAAVEWERLLNRSRTKMFRVQDMVDSDLKSAQSEIARHLTQLEKYTDLTASNQASKSLPNKIVQAEPNDAASQAELDGTEVREQE